MSRKPDSQAALARWGAFFWLAGRARARFAVWVTVASWALVLASCQKSGPKPPPNMTVDREVPRSGEVLDDATSEQETNRFLAEVPAGALGPRLSTSRDRDVAVWAVPDGEASGLYASFVEGDADPVSRRVADVDPRIEQLSVGHSKGGQILAIAVHESAAQQVLTATRLGPEGAFQAGPQVLATTPSSIVYTKVVPTALGAVVVWVERASGAADLYTVWIDEKGARRPHRLVRGVTAWQVVEGSGSFTVVTREGLDNFALVVRQVGDRGETIGAPIEVARDVVGGKDLDVAVTSQRILVAYSDKGPYEARLMGVLLDASGNVLRGGVPLTEPRGEQALLSVRAIDSERFQVAWHEPRQAHHGRPSVLVGELSEAARLVEPKWLLRVARKDPLLPLFAPHAGGLVALVDFECRNEPCSSELDRAAIVLPPRGPARSKKVSVSHGESAAMAWDLSCEGERCRYLLGDRAAPSRVYLGTVDPRTVSPDDLVARQPARGPTLQSHEVLGEVPELAELEGAVRADGERTLLAWLSYFQPDLPYVIPDQAAPDGRRAPVRARLTTVRPPTDGGAPAGETVISYRARSLGGVHLVAPENNRGLLVWSALDQSVPQLFSTVVDADGKKLSQKMLTRSGAEVTDVAAVRVTGGYVLSWVEGEGVSARVLALRVSESLIPVGTPRVVSPNAVSPSGVSLLSTESGVVCVWSDARASSSSGTADLYFVRLDPATGDPDGMERRLTKSDSHAHSPRLSAAPNGGVVVGWLSDSHEGEHAVFRMALLDSEGVLSGERVWDSADDARDFSLSCVDSACRAVVAVVSAQGSAPRVSLWALRAPHDSSKREFDAREILPLWAPGAEGVSPTLVGDDVYFADTAPHEASWQLRRARIRWE